MPTLDEMQLPAPKSWEELEAICWDLFGIIWNDPYAQRNGSPGQRQYGVDIWGRPRETGELCGVQVKLKDPFGGKLTKAVLLHEVEEAKGFEPPLSTFIIVTSAKRDASTQAVARKITDEHVAIGLFSVEVMSWDEITARLVSYPDLLGKFIERYYPQLKLRNTPEDAEEERHRPRFEVTSTAGAYLDRAFEPSWRLTQSNGDPISDIEWRFRGPRFGQVEWRPQRVHDLPRAHITQMVLLLQGTQPEDILVGVDQIGLEIRFYWRGKWRYELHRFPIARRVFPHNVNWDVLREVRPPILDNDP